jgi:hypothetical protein
MDLWMFAALLYFPNYQNNTTSTEMGKKILQITFQGHIRKDDVRKRTQIQDGPHTAQETKWR